MVPWQRWQRRWWKLYFKAINDVWRSGWLSQPQCWLHGLCFCNIYMIKWLLQPHKCLASAHLWELPSSAVRMLCSRTAGAEDNCHGCVHPHRDWTCVCDHHHHLNHFYHIDPLGEPWKQILLKVEILSICFPYNGRRITLWEHFAFNDLWSCKACRVHQGLLDYHDSVLHDKHYHDNHHHKIIITMTIIIMPVSPILIFFS